MNTPFEIRCFTERDTPEVAVLWGEALGRTKAWNEPADIIRRKQAMRDGLFFVGEWDGKVVATVIAGYDGIRGWIYSVAVAETHRRRGLGRRMVEHAEDVLRRRGCPKVNLQVLGSNRAVVGFYEQMEYVVEDRCSMGKPLRPGDALPPCDPAPTIEVGDGFELSAIRRSDKPRYVELLNETDQFNRFMWLIPYPYAESDAEFWLNRAMTQTLENDGVRNWSVRDQTGSLIGSIGFKGYVADQRAEVGYWLARSYWGRGLMPRILRRFSEYAFGDCGLRKLHARVIDGNAQSERVLQKAGFQKEGTLRDHEFRDGIGYDLHLYGFRQAEFPRAGP